MQKHLPLPSFLFIANGLLNNEEALYINYCAALAEAHPYKTLADNCPELFATFNKNYDVIKKFVYEHLFLDSMYLSAPRRNGYDASNLVADQSKILENYDHINDSRVYGAQIIIRILSTCLRRKVNKLISTQNITDMSEGPHDLSHNTINESQATKIHHEILIVDTFKYSTDQMEKLTFLYESMYKCQNAGLLKEANHFESSWSKELAKILTGDNRLERDIVVATDALVIKGKKQSNIANRKRHEASNKTKKEAINLYHSGSYKNASQAANQLFPQIKEIGELFNFKFNSDNNGERTVSNWFREADKLLNTKTSISNL
jgi:hypothetical protein